MTFEAHTTRWAPSRNRAAAAVSSVAVLVAVVLAARPRRLEVAGDSMRPALSPGERVLVLRRRPAVGDVVAVSDPSQPARVVLKRVGSTGPEGLWLLGDNPARSTDSRTWGWVDPSRVVGVAVYRYHPADRAGRLARGRYDRLGCR